ncbi:MAG TPA: phospholipase D family protein [Steroidobacteraceae bacterium]|nr:phospholipase D family protein [Steroidobacteraceae bacterium]
MGARAWAPDDDRDDTTLRVAQGIDPQEFAARPGQSACVLLDSGPLALLMRSVLADEACRTIDLQTYIYDDDEAGIVLMDRLRAAADRGVKVRLLIDDNGLRTDECLPLLLDSLPNAEVRVFNPFRLRPRWTRPLQMPLEFRRLNHRMHNKLFVVDGAATVVGGRNIGGHYFEAHEESNFTDLDVLLLGPVARDAEQCFERYWNCDLAVPLQAAMGKRDARMAHQRIERYVRAARFTRLQELYRTQHGGLRDTLDRARHEIHWATTRLLADDPRKACARRRRHAPQIMLDALAETWEQAREEVLAASAYFVPGRKGAGNLIRMRRRGVRVSILTNSLASNDVPTVHAGYTRYRRALLRAGVELYEYQRFGNRPRHHHGASRCNALHAKTLVIDRRLAWIGSFNLDPRSSRLNTEMAVLLESESLGRELARRIERDLAPDRSWRVMMRRGSRELRWIGEKNGAPTELTREPDASWWWLAWIKLARQFPYIERFL